MRVAALDSTQGPANRTNSMVYCSGTQIELGIGSTAALPTGYTVGPSSHWVCHTEHEVKKSPCVRQSFEGRQYWTKQPTWLNQAARASFFNSHQHKAFPLCKGLPRALHRYSWKGDEETQTFCRALVAQMQICEMRSQSWW